MTRAARASAQEQNAHLNTPLNQSLRIAFSTLFCLFGVAALTYVSYL